MAQGVTELTIRGAAEARSMQPPDNVEPSIGQEALLDRIEPQASTSAAIQEDALDEDSDVALSAERRIEPRKPWGLAEYGIPPPPADLLPDPSVETKLRHFHALRAQGVFFNNSLQSNKSFRNPSILSKLVDFVDVDEKRSAMPLDIWSSSHGVSSQAWAASIAERQKLESEERERNQRRGKRSGIDFATSSASSSRDRPRERLGGSAHAGTSSSRVAERSQEDRKTSRWDRVDSRRPDDVKNGSRDARIGQKDSRYAHRTRSRSPSSRRY